MRIVWLDGRRIRTGDSGSQDHPESSASRSAFERERHSFVHKPTQRNDIEKNERQ